MRSCIFCCLCSLKYRSRYGKGTDSGRKPDSASVSASGSNGGKCIFRRNKSAAVNRLDFVLLSALEIDTDFNVNVISGSDGVIRAASGGHSDTAAMAKVSIMLAPLTRGRLSTIIDKVTTVVTPGSTVDVVVTDYGVIVNPTRTDLIEKFTQAGIEMITMEEARAMATRLVGTPKEIEFTDEVVAVVEYRDGSVIDTIRKVK